MSTNTPTRLTHRGWLVVTLSIITTAMAVNIAMSGKCVTWNGIGPCGYVTGIEQKAGN